MFPTKMKVWAIVLICLPMSMGCAGLQVKRGVAGNTLYSSTRPRFNVEVAQGYEFLQERKDANSQFFSSSDGSANIEKEVYRFWNVERQREVQVQFHRISRQNAYWNKFDFEGYKNLIDAGVETINEDVYQYGVYTVVDGDGCFLVKAIGRRIGAQSNTKMMLYFAEKVGGEAAFSEWKNKEFFTADQRKRLQAFLAAFETDVKIGSYVERGS